MSPQLDRLTPELLQMIILYTHPSSHLSLALTCKQIYDNCGPVLAQHRAAHEAHRVISDVSPYSVPVFLEYLTHTYGPKAVKAFHVRELEIWGTRNHLNFWAPWAFEATGRASLDKPIPPPTERTCTVTYDEDFIGECVGQDHVEEAMAHIERQWDDGVLKMLLITTLPRLTSLKFAKNGVDPHSSLKWMSRAIQQSLDSGIWPPGLRRLRKVCVGIAIGAEPERSIAERRPIDLARLMMLPGLEELTFGELYRGDDEESEFGDRDYDDEDGVEEEVEGIYEGGEEDGLDDDEGEIGELPDAHELDRGDHTSQTLQLLQPGSSNIKVLVLDQTRDISRPLLRCIAQAPKSLETFVMREDPGLPLRDAGIETLIHQLHESQRASLQRLLYYSFFGYFRSGNEINYGTPLRSFENLRIVNISYQNIYFVVQSSKKGVDDIILDTFPPSLEVLGIWDDGANHGNRWRTAAPRGHEMLTFLDETVARMIVKNQFPNLRAIHLYDMEMFSGCGPLDFVAFKGAMEAGSKHGVLVNTVTNDVSEQASQDDFYALPAGQDLVSGLWARMHPRFIIHYPTGFELRNECGYCGTCQGCLRIYTCRAWGTLKAAETTRDDS